MSGVPQLRAAGTVHPLALGAAAFDRGASVAACRLRVGSEDWRAWLAGFAGMAAWRAAWAANVSIAFPVKRRPDRDGADWTAAERLVLEKLWACPALPSAAIARLLGRPERAVRIKAHRLGLANRRKRRS